MRSLNLNKKTSSVLPQAIFRNQNMLGVYKMLHNIFVWLQILAWHTFTLGFSVFN